MRCRARIVRKAYLAHRVLWYTDMVFLLEYLASRRTVTCSLVLNAFTQLTPTRANRRTLCRSLVKFTTGMQYGHDYFKGAFLLLGVYARGNTPSIVFYGNGIISLMVTVIFLQKPPALHQSSCPPFIYRWCNPFSPTSPIYMAGRLRTASRPSSTCMLSAHKQCSGRVFFPVFLCSFWGINRPG